LLNLQNYYDQVEKEEFIKLNDEKGMQSNLVLIALVEYRHSDGKYYGDKVNSSMQFRNKILENLSVLESSLLNLVGPFVPKENYWKFFWKIILDMFS